MPRGKRLNIIGGVYHLYTRGIERRRIFKDDIDREEFLSRLEDALTKTKSTCYAWSLMPNHIHLMIRTGKGSLSDVARRLLTGYAIYFNARHKRRGYLYQNRYKSILCQEDVYFQGLVRYIHLNHIKANIVPTLGKLDKYPWSGHSAIMGNKQRSWQNIDQVLLYFSEHRKKAINLYREFIQAGIGKKEKTDFLGGGLVRSAGGWTNLERMKRKKEYWRGDERILGDDSFVNQILNEAEETIDQRDKLTREGWDLDKIKAKVMEILEIRDINLNKKGRDNSISKVKALVCYFGNKELGISGAEIGRFLNISQPAVSKHINKGESIVENDGYKLLS
jgi:putative transposase